jgi:hypothetical protein
MQTKIILKTEQKKKERKLIKEMIKVNMINIRI